MDNNELGTNLAEVGTDCISRQAAIEALDVLCQEHRYKIPGKRETYSQYNEAWQDALDRAEGAIFNLPAAQPEIIRCAECKWFQCNMRQDGYLPKGVDVFECRHWRGYCDPTDFCSYAERRTDG